MSGEEVSLTRLELYQLVWSEPLSKIAPRYGISDVGLAKICRRARIPVPGRGYWAKRQHGHHIRRTPLPKARRGDEETPDPTTMRRALLERQPVERTPANCHTIATPGGFLRASRLGLSRGHVRTGVSGVVRYANARRGSASQSGSALALVIILVDSPTWA